jgi:adenine phosphoribosyltransferase
MPHPLEQHIALVPDFPKPGIAFKDITPLLKDHFQATIDAMAQAFSTEEWNKVDYIAGIEARGFILASALSMKLGKGLVLIRKHGKLPPPVISHTYELEYGSDTLQIQEGKGNIVIADDVLATGGTLKAACYLSERAGYSLSGLLCLINLSFLHTFQHGQVPLRGVITY